MHGAVAAALLSACSCGSTPPPGAPTTPAALPPAPAGPTYEVHEWGLVRSTAADHPMLSGPHAEPPALPVAKPVLYFHRSGDGPLSIEVEAAIRSGRIVEHWPRVTDDEPGSSVTWTDVVLEEGSCHGARYPEAYSDPCTRRWDGCEAAELARVETTDADCARWAAPRMSTREPWNHLFYRGEVDGTPDLGVRLEPQPDGTLRVVSTSSDPIVGRIVRIHRGSGVPDRVAVAEAPPPGGTAIVPVASESLATGADALGESLSAAGLTADEIAAFRRAWDETLFGTRLASAPPSAVVTTTPPVAMPVVPPPSDASSILYVLPLSTVETLATLRFDPAPTAVRRAIVAWVDEASPPVP